MAELAEQIRDFIDGCAPAVTLDDIRARVGEEHELKVFRTPRARRARTWWVVAATVLVVALVASIVVSRSEPSPRKAAAQHQDVQTPRWDLTAALSGPQFQLATGNPSAVVGVDCGTGGTCFLSTGYGNGGDASNNGSTYVSHDGGHTWTPSPLPSNVAATTLVSCVSAAWCAAGGGLADPSTGGPAAGKVMRDPELLVTSDGGETWTMHSVPVPPDVQELPAYGNLPAETTYWPASVDAVSCSAPGVCNVITHVLNSTTVSGIIPDNLVFAATSDGGVTWSTSTLPELPDETGYEVEPAGGVGISSLSCPTATTCVVSAHLGGFSSGQAAFDAWRTTDGGDTWRETRLASGSLAQVSGSYSALTCPDVTTCWAGPTLQSSPNPNGALLHSTDGGATWSPVALPAPPKVSSEPQVQSGASSGWDALSCTSISTCYVAGAGIDVTTDSGKTWQPAALPAQVEWVQSISCEIGDQAVCVGAATPQTSSNFMPYGGSLMIASGLPH